MKLPKNCACGEPMHLSDAQLFLLNTMGKFWGNYKKVCILEGKLKCYKIPTYYIVLHGLNYKDVLDCEFSEIPS